MADDDSATNVKRFLLIGTGLVAVLVVCLVACSPSRACGDYDRETDVSGNTYYEYDPNDGDYDLVNGEYTYVGCRSGSSSGGGVWFFGGSSGNSGGNNNSNSNSTSDSSGSSNRGGGPGWGK
ncbi:hypothetical protein [Actinorugispora endophytica]|uniref:Uncharacterized protein n=1 Tax=Actinorugispora endophytica TaxID=1605990 RepID=A0A4R6USY8_9ACTN|nr:hypothetical protein [Actinorugispora endophytica]TDQ48793.1 hypothetical protein EV190_11749 [Actinorugispora endophytica]